MKKNQVGSVLSTALIAGATWLGPGWGVQRCSAQFFPGAPGDEMSYSIGVFQLTVDPAFTYLFNPHPFTPGNYYYPGFSPAGGVLTSPVMYDFSDTWIGVSKSHIRNTTSPTYFSGGGVVVGTTTENSLPLFPANFPHSITSYSTYANLPSAFSSAPNGIDEIMTEIEGFNLATTTGSAGQLNCSSNSDPRVPSVPVSVNMVVAGPHYIPNLPPNRRSIGMVQQLTPPVVGTDFPAQSFFNIYVEVTLPIIMGNNSYLDFPPNSGNPVPPNYQSGAVLYNDASDPLVIINTNVTSLPPTAVYIHGITVAVPMRFKFANPPYWAANDLMGYLQLAGHGVIPNPSNNCAQVAAAVTTTLDQTLGPVGSSIPGMPVPWLRMDDTFPTPNSGYSSRENTFVDPTTGNTNVLDDVVTFNDPSLGLVYLSDLQIGGFTGSIPPPAVSSTYNQLGTSLDGQFSFDGVNYYPFTAIGPITMDITNEGPGNPVIYKTAMLGMDFVGSILDGPFAGVSIELRQDPLKNAYGQHTIGPDPRGFRVTSYFDLFTDINIDGGGFYPASSSIRVQASAPPAVPNSIFLTRQSTNIILQWQNSFTLQSSANVLGPWADVPGPVVNGPYTNTVIPGAPRTFYRIRQ